jgi:hypothetical protein
LVVDGISHGPVSHASVPFSVDHREFVGIETIGILEILWDFWNPGDAFEGL